jgi:antitoxin PrlF
MLEIQNLGISDMKENLILSNKGQVTLPAAMRKSLGLSNSAVLVAEQVGGKIVLTPAVVLETEIYSPEQIAEWDRADSFEPGERERLASRLARRG